MDFDLPPANDPRRLAVKQWLAGHPQPTATQLVDAGYVVPHWPEPWGLNADPLHQIIIDDELAKAGVSRPANQIGIGWAGPTLLTAGTEEQKQRYLRPLLTGQEIWCQMFSEPDAGSDLANVATRAVRDGDEYVVNGSKIWTSAGHLSQFGILIARTNPEVPKHEGISYFICPTDLPGLTMTPIVDATGSHLFNQVFFDDVRLPASLRVGAEGEGWRLAKVTLANERVRLSAAGSLWGRGPSAEDLLNVVRSNGGCADPVMRQELAGLKCEAEVLRLNRLRTLTAQLAGRTPGPEASVQKAMSDDHGQRVMALAKACAGTAGMLAGSGPGGRTFDWHFGFLFSPALTIGGGTFAIQRNIVAEKVLGLPRDHNVEDGLSWRETHLGKAGRNAF